MLLFVPVPDVLPVPVLVPEVPLASVAPPDAEVPPVPELPLLSVLVPVLDDPVPDIVPLPDDGPALLVPLLMFRSDVDDEELVCARPAPLAPSKEMSTANESFFMPPPDTNE